MSNEDPDIKYQTVHGDVANIYLGTSLERIVVYICVTVAAVVFIIYRS